MPKVLILHASLGTGHVSAANSLGEAFKQLGVENVQIEDILDHASSLMRVTLTKSYLQMSEKAPQLWRLLFEKSDAEDLDESLRDNVLLGRLSSAFASDFKELVRNSQADIVICTMQIPAMVTSRLKRKGEIDSPLYIVITDFIAHSTWFHYGANGYFLPGDITHYQLKSLGLPEEILHVTGIPVKPEIARPKAMDEMRIRHNLPPEGNLVTLFGGGILSERVKTMVSLLLESETPLTLAIVAGRNRKLLTALEDLQDTKTVKLLKLGRIDFVDDLVAASNLVISKAGGLITSEILARGTPMVIIDPIPGQEEWNADMVAAAGAGVQLRMPEMAAYTAMQLLTQPERLTAMRAGAKRIGHPDAALNIAKQVLQELG